MTEQAGDKALIEKGQRLKLKMLTSHANSQVSLLHLLFFSVILFFYDPVCPHPHVQRCVATVCASMGASVGRDPTSFVTVLQGSTDPAASMVSRNILTVFHCQNLFSCLLFYVFCAPFIVFPFLCPLFVLIFHSPHTQRLNCHTAQLYGGIPRFSITVSGCSM